MCWGRVRGAEEGCEGRDVDGGIGLGAFVGAETVVAIAVGGWKGFMRLLRDGGTLVSILVEGRNKKG